MRRFSRYAWFVLAFNVLVILWGAYVRASKSGDGCGSHWPLCNGSVVPDVSALRTVVEFAHRLSSGVALLLVIGLAVWAWRAFGPGHPARRGAVLSLVFILLEALIGAVLVRKGYVANNDTIARAGVFSIHLINTFLLLASLTLTAWQATAGAPLRLTQQSGMTLAAVIGLASVVILGVSGAVTALGDTLFPAASLAEALRQDLSPTAHLFIRLRVFHPLIAAAVGAYLLIFAGAASFLRPGAATKRYATLLASLVLTQLLVGLVNVALLAPIWLQLIHLFLADATWIALVLLSAATLAQGATAPESLPHARLRPA